MNVSDHGHNGVTLFLHSSRPSLPGSEVQAQTHTASALPKVIYKMSQQESGRPGMRFGSTPISWLIYRPEENYLKQTDCCSLRHWKGEKSSHDTTPCISRGKGNRTVYAGRVMKTDNETLSHILVPQFFGSQLNGALFSHGLWFSLGISH